VIHLAAESHVDRSITDLSTKNKCWMVMNLLNAAKMIGR
jgi:dTDP-D-glucose 4,6-dehydratase